MLKPYINGSAHHMDHHLYYNYNYGQFFTLWDRIGSSFRTPSSFIGEGPIEYIKEIQQRKQQGISTDDMENDTNKLKSD